MLSSNKIAVGISMVLLLATLGCQQSDNSSGNAIIQVDPALITQRGQLRFITDSIVGRQLASQQGKPCLLFFTAEWCTLCHQMEATTLSDPTIEKLAEDFVCVLVDADREPEICLEFKVRGYPTVQFIAADGRKLHQLVGRQPTPKLAVGMQAALERTAWLENVESNKR